jgi:serine/threonine-protein kinase ATR
MNSLQQPKVVTIVGTNGKNYRFLCKPKDDMRKDQRMNEFDAMINKYVLFYLC